jgi:ankyrin repeat protein
LHSAAIKSSPEAAADAIRLLVAAGADVAATDGSGNQALHWALKDTYSVHELDDCIDS